MRITQLWRFPVKSLQGEQIQTICIGPQGLDGDRQLAIFDQSTGFGLTARRCPELLFASALTRADESVEIRLPNGDTAADDAALSAWLRRPVTLRSTTEQLSRRFEIPVDFEQEDNGRWRNFSGSEGAFHDSTGATVSIVSETTISTWAPARFRTNLLLDTADEDRLIGTTIAVGEAHLRVGMRIKRCVMATRAQPGGIGRDLDVLRTIHLDRGGYLAVGATVANAGTVSVGDTVIAVS
jgi:uncharacterized protein YcbX